MKIVINGCYGGFSISPKAVLRYAELCGFKVYCYLDVRMMAKDYLNTKKSYIRVDDINTIPDKFFSVYWLKNDLGEKVDEINNADWLHERDIERNDPNLVRVVEELGKDADGMCASLRVVEIPDDVEWEIDEYDGLESIDEVHRSWG